MNAKRTTFLLSFGSLAAAGAAGCSAYSSTTPVAIDCSSESAYVFDTPIPLNQSYTATDGTPGSGASSAMVQTIPGGALCNDSGAANALVIDWTRNNDWGGLVGFYPPIGNTGNFREEAAYEGLSFWARASGSRSFTLGIDDANTYGGNADAGMNCVNYAGDGGATIVPGTYVDPTTGMTISGSGINAPPADACGNSYTDVVTVSADWRFYTFPFSDFHQGAMPNRVPNVKLSETGDVPGSGLLTDKIMNLIFRFPRGATTELWIAKLTFYRTDTTGDGGVD
jgi:hypothetical protein